jgi:hypothetical protein
MVENIVTLRLRNVFDINQTEHINYYYEFYLLVGIK